MENKTKIKFILAGAAAALTVLLIILVKTADVAAIGAAGTSVGLSSLNQSVHDFSGVSWGLYTATEWIGYAAIAAAAAFAALGLAQLIKRKSLLKVDREILALAALYLTVIALYLFFEIVVVNCRPVLTPGKTEAEASFPSSHTMAVGVIAGSAVMLLKNYIKNTALLRILQAVGCSALLFTAVGRLFSGVHWFTDILGGALIVACLLLLFSGALDLIGSAKKKREADL